MGTFEFVESKRICRLYRLPSSEAYASIASYKYFMDQTYDQFLGAYLKGMKNDDLKWQEKLDYNIGIDVDIAHNFTLKFDYYISQTTNTLLDFTIPLPPFYFCEREYW